MKYWEIVEECQQIYTELSYNSRWVRIAMFHLIGKTLSDNADTVEGHIRSIASALNITGEDLAAAIYLADKYPNLDDFNHDKTISWNQLKGEILEEIKAQ